LRRPGGVSNIGIIGAFGVISLISLAAAYGGGAVGGVSGVGVSVAKNEKCSDLRQINLASLVKSGDGGVWLASRKMK
jgi:hypothetical protein